MPEHERRSHRLLDPRVSLYGGVAMAGLAAAALFAHRELWRAQPALAEAMQRTLGSAPPRALGDLLVAGTSLPAQLALGAVAGGLLAALPLAFFFGWAPWRRVTDTLVARLDRPLGALVVVAACAGIFEELLFRAALQPLAGFWLSNLAFTLAHVGGGGAEDDPLVTRNRWRLRLIGWTVIFALGSGCAWLFAQFGLLCAMVAHFVCDLVVFLVYRRVYRWDGRATAATG